MKQAGTQALPFLDSRCLRQSGSFRDILLALQIIKVNGSSVDPRCYVDDSRRCPGLDLVQQEVRQEERRKMIHGQSGFEPIYRPRLSGTDDTRVADECAVRTEYRVLLRIGRSPDNL
jgi:hypothetical protein